MDMAANPQVIRQHLIDPEICIRCNTCEATCPVGAITHDSRNYVVDADKCNFCMACVPPCPTGSIDNWRTMPKVQAYVLPADDLRAVAEGSGLQWVNSDADKVQAVQAAIAAEPQPVHVPRERPAPVVVDEGPLVLVETRRDLRAMTLPFEQQPLA